MIRVMSIVRIVNAKIRRMLFPATVKLETIEDNSFPPRCIHCNSVMDSAMDDPTVPLPIPSAEEIHDLYLSECRERERYARKYKAEYDAVVRRPEQGRSYTIDEACEELGVDIWSPQIEDDPRVEDGIFFCVKRFEDEIGTILSEKHIAFVLATGRIEVTTGGWEFVSYEDVYDVTPKSVLEDLLSGVIGTDAYSTEEWGVHTPKTRTSPGNYR